jgi:tRNA-dihydrouridine synthase
MTTYWNGREDKKYREEYWGRVRDKVVERIRWWKLQGGRYDKVVKMTRWWKWQGSGYGREKKKHREDNWVRVRDKVESY